MGRVVALQTRRGLAGDFRPTRAGEIFWMPQSWPFVKELLSVGSGDVVKLAGYAGDALFLPVGSIFRPLIGFPAGKWIYTVQPGGGVRADADPAPPEMTTIQAPNEPEPFPIAKKAYDLAARMFGVASVPPPPPVTVPPPPNIQPPPVIVGVPPPVPVIIGPDGVPVKTWIPPTIPGGTPGPIRYGDGGTWPTPPPVPPPEPPPSVIMEPGGVPPGAVAEFGPSAAGGAGFPSWVWIVGVGAALWFFSGKRR